MLDLFTCLMVIPFLGLVTCNRSLSVRNGILNKVGFYYGAGSNLVLTCIVLYAVIGSSTFVCTNTGEWKGNSTCGM